MKIYIAGPMSGVKSFNFPAFDAAAAKLREFGHDVISPAELDDSAFRTRAMMAEGTESDLLSTWGDCLARDVKLITDERIEAIALLPNWWASRGANLEAIVGLLNGVAFYAYDSFGLLERVQNATILDLICQGFRHRWSRQ